MSLRKLLSRIALVGLVQAGILVAIIAASSGTQMSAQEASAILLPEPPPVEIEPSTPAPAVVPGSEQGLFGPAAGVRAGDLIGDGPFIIEGDAFIVTDELGDSTLVLSEDFRSSRGNQQLVISLQTNSGTRIELGELNPQGAQEFDVPFINLDVFDELIIIDEPFEQVIGRADLAPLT